MKDTGGPAFPFVFDDMVKHTREVYTGMTLRQYAAIKLKVPDSGTDWLDEMIVKANEFDRELLTLDQQSSTM
jgi:hypothetical protein